MAHRELEDDTYYHGRYEGPYYGEPYYLVEQPEEPLRMELVATVEYDWWGVVQEEQARCRSPISPEKKPLLPLLTNSSLHTKPATMPTVRTTQASGSTLHFHRWAKTHDSASETTMSNMKANRKVASFLLSSW